MHVYGIGRASVRPMIGWVSLLWGSWQMASIRYNAQHDWPHEGSSDAHLGFTTREFVLTPVYTYSGKIFTTEQAEKVF